MCISVTPPAEPTSDFVRERRSNDRAHTCLPDLLPHHRSVFFRGNTVIARKLGPAEEIITQHGGGILYTRPEELRPAIAKMIGDDRTRLELGRQALAAHDREFSEEVYLRRYLDIVAELCTQKAAGRNIRATKRAP